MEAKPTLILDATRPDDPAAAGLLRALADMLKQSRSRVLILRPGDMKIAPCRACFDCWLKTPGLCAVDDDGKTVSRALARAGRLVFFTPIVFGTYSPEIKNAVERSIGVLLPTFRKRHGETHHPVRYPMAPDLIGVGFTDRPDAEAAEIFRRHLTRNALNFDSRSIAAVVVSRDRPLEEGLKELARSLENMQEVGA